MVNEQDREKAREVFDYIELQFDEDPTYDMIDAGVAKIAAALAEAREEGFHEGKEFAIVTIGNAITGENAKDMPFMAFQIACKALRGEK